MVLWLHTGWKIDGLAVADEDDLAVTDKKLLRELKSNLLASAGGMYDATTKSWSSVIANR